MTRLAAFRYRDFRLVWTGELISTSGSQMQTFAINWHIFQLLNGQITTLNVAGLSIDLSAEALGLGILGLVRILPIIVFSLLGGVLADAFDRRRLMVVTRGMAALLALVLAALTLTDQVTVSLIYLVGAAAAGLMAFDSPARQSLVPHLVKAEHLTNAISLNQLILQLATIIGPALAGVLIGMTTTEADSRTIGWVYVVTCLSFIVAGGALLLIRYRSLPNPDGYAKALSWTALRDGLHFTFSTRIIRGTMLLDFFAVFFGSARTMLPIVASNILGVGAAGYGLLATAQPLGSLIAGIIMALRKDIYRQGQVLLISVAVYGVATALFGLSTVFILSYVLFAVTGAGDTVSAVIRNTIRQLQTPDHLRGRMTGVNMIFAAGGPQLGELEAGLVAAALGVPFAIVSGGIATVLLTAWVAWRYPRLRRYTSAEHSAVTT
jgi:MFS family permease